MKALIIRADDLPLQLRRFADGRDFRVELCHDQNFPFVPPFRVLEKRGGTLRHIGGDSWDV